MDATRDDHTKRSKSKEKGTYRVVHVGSKI